MRYMLHNEAISVIPACPESSNYGEKDSGQAGMTLGCIFQLLYAVTKANFKCEGPLVNVLAFVRLRVC
jgi:hypothetical protein